MKYSPLKIFVVTTLFYCVFFNSINAVVPETGWWTTLPHYTSCSYYRGCQTQNTGQLNESCDAFLTRTYQAGKGTRVADANNNPVSAYKNRCVYTDYSPGVPELYKSSSEQSSSLKDPNKYPVTYGYNPMTIVTQILKGTGPLLTVIKAGSGTGKVTGTTWAQYPWIDNTVSPIIDCGATCSVNLIGNDSYLLYATPDPGYTFSGWSGACSGTSYCFLTMSANQSVTANFNPGVTANISPASNSVPYNGITSLSLTANNVNSCTLTGNGNTIVYPATIGAMTKYNGTGGTPYDIAFDGTNMWTVNAGNNSVTKIKPDGSMTTYTGTGSGPNAIALNNVTGDMWTANVGDNSVTKINTTTGAMTNYPGTGIAPRGIAFDGTNMWTANTGTYTSTTVGGFPLYAYHNTSVTKITSTGAMTTYPIFTDGTPFRPAKISFDGSNLWLTANSAARNTPGDIIAQITLAGLVTTTYDLTRGPGNYPSHMAFEGSNVWVGYGNNSGVSKINKNNGSAVYYNVGVTAPSAIAYDGTSMWTANQFNNMGASSVSKIALDGTVTTYQGTGAQPLGIAFDGINMWTADTGSNSATKIKTSANLSGSQSSGPITSNTTFLLSCTGNGGSANSSATISVTSPVCTDWTYSSWGSCSAGYQTRTATPLTPAGCTGGTPVISQSCPCTSFTYNTWGTCNQTTGIQTRTVATSLPSGCGGGIPVLSQSCVSPVTATINTPSFVVPIHTPTTISWSSTGADACAVTKNVSGFSPVTLSTALSSTGISTGNIDYYTTFIINCTNGSGGSGSSNKSVSPSVRVIRADPDIISWEVADATSCTLKDGSGNVVASSGGEATLYNPGNIDAGITFTLECDVPGPDPFILTTVSVLPIPKSLCTPSQQGRAVGDNNIYVNRNTTWSVAPYTSGTNFSSTNRKWAGTNISGTPTGITFDKIYTTVGLKTIYATTTGIMSDGTTPFTSVCTATTTVKLDAGSGGEI